jgi:glycerophosphoryl diester phosphodiesterase
MTVVRTILLFLYVVGIYGTAHAAEPSSPFVVAHRGLLLHAPENTLTNFRACLQLRLGFEFDVQKTSDGQLVCIHDATVDRTTSGKGQVSESTLTQIRGLDAGRWFDAKFTDEKVPTVEEVLKLIADHAGHDILVAVDLKAEGVEEQVVRLAVKHQVLDRLVFIGSTISQPTVRARIKQVSATAQTAALANNEDELGMALSVPNTDWIYVRFVPTKQQVEAVHRQNKRVFIAGTMVSGQVPKNWQKTAEAGVDGILTDFPLELAAMLRAR